MCDAARNFAISRLSVLAELRLENYAGIDNVDIEFASGLVLLTGEAVAAKSKAAWSIRFPGLSFSLVAIAAFTSRRFFPPQRTS